MRRRIVIVGAGVVGLTMAARLATIAAKLDIRVIDAAPAAPQDSGELELRVSAIANASMAALAPCWDQVPDDRQCSYEQMCVWDAADAPDSPNAVRFSAAEFGVPQLGSIVENAALQRALLAYLAGTDTTVSFDSGVATLHRSRNVWTLDLDGGGTLTVDLIIAADGGRSRIRSLLDIQSTEHDYGQSAVVTHLRPEHSHAETAWQRFLPSGPIALLPLRDGRVSTVWSLPTDDARAALELDPATLSAKISDASDHVLGALTIDGPTGSFPLIAQHADTYVRTGAVLIGDAAHSIHPMAGQGANLGIQDAVVLAGCLEDALEQGWHPGEPRVLRRYERERREANAAMLNGLTALNGLFAHPSEVVAAIRRSGMRLFNSSSFLRSRAVQAAVGDLDRWLS
jgi:2-octaprenylphenol hydroxylase